MDLIGDETAIDDLRQLALETAESLARRLVLGEFALVVVSAEPRIEIPEPVRDAYKLWRPTPLFLSLIHISEPTRPY